VIYDSIILGGGAAGLYCAQAAGQRGRRVVVLEHNREVGAKIVISGGGRCNFTNLHTAPERFLSANPHFARSPLARHPPEAFIALLQRHKIAFYEKTLGQLFCEGDGAARKVVAMLRAECTAAGVEIRTGVQVGEISKPDRFRIETDAGPVEANCLVIACGGLSIPKLGASDLAYRLARQFDLPVIEPRPGLVPLTFSGEDLVWMQTLSGVSTEVVARAGKASFREAALFTHRGLSGPVILQASSYWRRGEPMVIDWAPDAADDFLIARKRTRPKIQIKTALEEILPARLADVLARRLPAGALADMKDASLRDAGQQIKAFALTPSGDEGFAKAEVTVGGVDTGALSQQTMGARAIPGLFVIGEAVDVTGWLGGYNFQWAWSSAFAAAQAL
jgi:predicted Rossmann fold flavoprotein